MIMRWMTYMTTCERAKSTIQLSLASLARAGWNNVNVLVDTDKLGSRNALLRACLLAGYQWGQWHRLLVVQDDVLFVSGLRGWLEREIMASEALRLPGVISLWLPEVLQKRGEQGWWQLSADDLPRRAYGALAYVLDLSAVDAILAVGNYNGKPNQSDWFVGHVCKQECLPYWYYRRSFCQHIGDTSTISPGAPWFPEYRQAARDWCEPCDYTSDSNGGGT